MTDTKAYKLNHSMLRITDPVASIKFYEQLGMKVMQQFEMPAYSLNLYFLAFDFPSSIGHGKITSDREGVLELSYSYGTKEVHNGNADPQGFSQICISVDDIQATCGTLKELGCKFHHDHPTVVLDPDGYWVRLIAQSESNRMHHTTIRVKDGEKSVKFYQDVFGMTLHQTFLDPESRYSSFFLGYDSSISSKGNERYPDATNEGMLELVWEHGTENQAGKVYHNGNSEPEGFGHICVSVDDTQAACKQFEEKGVRWQKRLEEGPFRIAFALDPDDYWIEIIQNERYKPPGHEF